MNDKVKPAIIVFPASNCEMDMDQVLRGYDIDPIHLWHSETTIPDDISHVILPGGFSFGDYLRAGALAATCPIMEAIKQFAAKGGPLLGVCNGFQILCEAKLLPGTLLKNYHDRFVCRVESVTWFGAKRRCQEPITLRLPIAHREGRYYADPSTIDELKRTHRIALSYNERNEAGDAACNGACDGIAGIIGGPHNNILGLMPHPERMIDDVLLGSDGRIIMEDFLFG